MPDEITEEEIHRLADNIRRGVEGKRFLSDADIDDVDIEIIRNNIGKISMWHSESNDACIVVAYAMVDVGVRRYESSFWEPFEEECKNTGLGLTEYLPNLRNRMKTSFFTAIDSLGLDPHIDTPREREWILIQCFVPNSDLDGFFRFCFNYCDNVLGFDTDDLDFQFCHLADFIKAFREGSSDIFVEEFGDALPNPYLLDACVRHMLTNPELFSEKMKSMVDLIVDTENSCLSSEYDLPDRVIDAYRKWHYNQFEVKGNHIGGIKAEHRVRLMIRQDNSLALFIPRGTYPSKSHLSIKLGGIEIEEVRQPRFRPIKGLDRLNLKDPFILPLDEIGEGIEPFDEFIVDLGTRSSLYRSRPNRKYVFFNKNGLEVKDPPIGYGRILFKGIPEFSPNGCVLSNTDGILEVDLEEDAVISVCGTQFKIGGGIEKNDEISVGYSSFLSARIVDHDDEIPVTTDSEVAVSIDLKSKRSKPTLYIEVPGKKSISCIVNSESKIQNIYRNGSHMDFRFNLDDFIEESSIVRIRIIESTFTKIQQNLVYLKRMDPRFDKEYYLDKPVGTLCLGDGRKICFDSVRIDDPYLRWNEQMSGLDVIIQARIPVLLINMGVEWSGPGSYDTRLINIRRYLKIYAGFDININLYPKGVRSKLSNKLPQTIINEYPAFDLGSMIDEMRSHPDGDYSLWISIGSANSRLLARIYTHNEYNVDTKSATIAMASTAGTDAVIEILKGASLIKRVSLHEGLNSYQDCIGLGNILRIKEKKIDSNNYDVQIGPDYLIGSSLWYEPGGNGFILHHGSDLGIFFDSNPGDIIAIRKEIEMKSRFNPWMKGDKFIKELESLFKRD